MAGMKPAKFYNGTSGSLELENDIEKFNNLLNPFSGDVSKKGQIPFYSSGARCLIRVGGKPLGVAQSVRWNISYTANPINTIDSNFPWDIDVGQVKISASLSLIIDPTKGPEHDGIFHIMKSAIHAPMVEIQIIDKGFGTQLLYARGMFTEIGGNVAMGNLSGWSAGFTGVAYQHYVNQKFEPYTGTAGAAGALLDSLQGIASDLTGGFL